MNIYKHFSAVVQAILADLAASGSLPAGLDTARVVVEAPRAWPAVSGPVGLAETYSTLTRLPLPSSLSP